MVVTFADFRKACDSVDRQTLNKILKKLALHNKTRRLILQNLTDTHCKIKFRGEFSKRLDIKARVKQADGLSYSSSTVFFTRL